MRSHETIIPAMVFPLGDSIREELVARGWTQRLFATRLGRPTQAVNEIIRGRRQITAETALALGEVLGTSAELWMGLEGRYRLHLARKNRERQFPAGSPDALPGSIPQLFVCERAGTLPNSGLVP